MHSIWKGVTARVVAKQPFPIHVLLQDISLDHTLIDPPAELATVGVTLDQLARAMFLSLGQTSMIFSSWQPKRSMGVVPQGKGTVCLISDGLVHAPPRSLATLSGQKQCGILASLRTITSPLLSAAVMFEPLYPLTICRGES